jgi:hypothetical protein
MVHDYRAQQGPNARRHAQEDRRLRVKSHQLASAHARSRPCTLAVPSEHGTGPAQVIQMDETKQDDKLFLLRRRWNWRVAGSVKTRTK